MINGEGMQKDRWGEDPFDEFFPGRGNDSGDEDGAPSNYSSCEGSDLERYCSANSALGSASLCSSVGNYSDLLDSFKNLNSFGEDLFSDGCGGARDKLHSSRWNGDPATSDGDGDDCLSNKKAFSPHLFLSSSKMLVSSEGMHADYDGASTSGSRSNQSPAAAQDLPCSAGDRSAQESLAVEGNGRNYGQLASDNPIRRGMMGEADEDASSICEHSGGEDSMLDSGTDDEGSGRILLHAKHSSYHAKETKDNNENPLVMNSSVAFGSDDWDEFMQETGDDGLTSLSFCGDQPTWRQLEPSETEGNISLLAKNHVIDPLCDGIEQEEGVSDLPAASFQVQVADKSNKNEGTCLVGNPSSDCKVSNSEKLLSEEYFTEGAINLIYDGGKGEINSLHSKVAAVVDSDGTPGEQVFGESVPLGDGTGIQFSGTVSGEFQDKESRIPADKAFSFLPTVIAGHDSGILETLNGKSNSVDMVEEDLILDEVKNPDTNDSFDEMVLDMEEILLDSGSSHRSKFTLPNRGHIAQQSHHFRDGSSTASTSGTDDTYPIIQYPSKIDWVEVVGAKQKKGDVSFGERLVGVKEYTVYILRVWSGKDQWEVERRYRDFDALYQQLRILFIESGLALPSSWSSVERESRKIFGNASPNVVSERSMLIQDCLRSILNSRYPFGTPSPLVCFLSPGKAVHSPSLLKALVPRSLQKLREDWNLKVSNCGKTGLEDVLTLGKTISLVVEIKPRKSTRQLLESQHYTCAGCHIRLDAGKTLLGELVQTLGWKKPRFCEYTGQLFCASCHTNDTAVLPARVLNLWDFSLYPVSQLAKAYLESIYDQPMLCVSAVNPFLFSKVPALLHIMSIRKKIGAMLPYVRCPFRKSIQRGLGCRRHLLEGNDFFALRDLVDLSKGAFAALPIMVETISNGILEHISQQCLMCYDAGVPCAARQACDDPSSLIFPFQEADAARCGSCGSLFHEPCFRKLMGCPCGKPTSTHGKELLSEDVSHGAGKELEGDINQFFQPSSSNSVSGFLSDILSKARPDKIWKPRSSSPVILMGSLPSTSL
ncbi:uncharacterized protein LOC103708169 [Phoenix dactylifera]|uniref:Uncharacterized protein LOC103708169 n=1 Tax=Phoenix dactylifera TaxID=42345 RepID=A0A8B7C3W5_PHODC|nr:uncharacterized protein LOC103708169 [Phoenix dactylifera]XP_008791192.2 uncharacterized protein LOC103708169 [Phoenix dactylifera]